MPWATPPSIWPAGEDGMEDLADLLEGVEVCHGGGVGAGVDGDLGDVDGPGVGGVGVAFVLVVVPEDVAGCLVAGATFEGAIGGEEGDGGGLEGFAAGENGGPSFAQDDRVGWGRGNRQRQRSSALGKDDEFGWGEGRGRGR